MRYGFGLLAYQIGQVAAHSNDQISVIYPYVEEFAHAIGETCAIAAWMDQGVVMVRWYEANKTISISLKPGRRVPLSTSSTGRMFGAFLPRATTENIVRTELQARGINTDAEVEKLYEEYSEIREIGISQSIGKHIPGISSLSAPVFDYTGQPILVISVIGNESTFDASMTGANAHTLLNKCTELSRLLGSSSHVSAR
ncbi:MAG: IclR family transcriptional regulator [Pigmentiphaga sp.]